jgi:hypothetical protein
MPPHPLPLLFVILRREISALTESLPADGGGRTAGNFKPLVCRHVAGRCNFRRTSGGRVLTGPN